MDWDMVMKWCISGVVSCCWTSSFSSPSTFTRPNDSVGYQGTPHGVFAAFLVYSTLEAKMHRTVLDGDRSHRRAHSGRLKIVVRPEYT